MNNKYCVTRTPLMANSAIGEKGKFWPVGGTLSIGFLGGTNEQKDFVKQHASEWLDYINLSFVFTDFSPLIRISFIEGNGAWSYIGTDSATIPSNLPTMNFGWLDKSVVLHEFGHALGLGHEHQNPIGGIQWNEPVVIGELSGPPNYWTEREIRWNVLDAYNQDLIIGTELDPKSIMMYPIPNAWTIGDFSTGFNEELSDIDKKFIQSVYPYASINCDKEVVSILSKMFQSQRDVKRMREDSIIQMGHKLGAVVDKRYLKCVNAENVWKKLTELNEITT